MNHDPLDTVLLHHFTQRGRDESASDRVLAKLQVLPAQKRPTRWPQVLLDWQFALAWPRLAALAGCAALGFILGSTSINRLGGSFAPATGNDLVSIAFQPEAMTGLRP